MLMVVVRVPLCGIGAVNSILDTVRLREKDIIATIKFGLLYLAKTNPDPNTSARIVSSSSSSLKS